MPHLKQSFSWWCFQDPGVAAADLIREAARIGYEGVDLVGEKFWPLIADAGLKIAAIDGHGTISEGLNRRDQAARIEGELRAKIEKAAKWNIPVLICFSGNRGKEDDDRGLAICAETLERVAPEAAQAGVKLAVELLNSKVDHADYQADHTSWGLRLCEKVRSPAVGLLYDIYHMQIMEGDLIRTINASHAHIVHYHTAGNPGRGPMNDGQEIYYPAIYRAIAATGYEGFIGHEFIPTTDPVAELRTAYEQCRNA
jgi:hydroxypyruvate isomerase